MTRRVFIGSPLDLTMAKDKLDDACTAYEKAVDALLDAVAGYTESNVAAYSLAHPRRKVEFMGSMGIVSLMVEGSNGKELVSFSGYDDERVGDHVLTCPEFMTEIGQLEDSTRINGLSQALGSVIYLNGKRFKG